MLIVIAIFVDVWQFFEGLSCQSTAISFEAVLSAGFCCGRIPEDNRHGTLHAVAIRLSFPGRKSVGDSLVIAPCPRVGCSDRSISKKQGMTHAGI